MNEIGLLRSQLAAERAHVREVALACAAAYAGEAAPDAFGATCVRYLQRVLGWFEQRERRLGELYARLPATDSGRRALEALGSDGTARKALAMLTVVTAADTPVSAGSASQAWAELSGFLSGAWNLRCGAIDRLLASNPRVADWRVISGVDADSALEERALYGRVRGNLPPGIRLVAGPA